VPGFTAGRSAEIRQKLVEFSKQGVHKLVLDLRDCASGTVQEAVATANLFVNSGTITTLRGQTVPAKEFTADPQKTVWTGPVTVLLSARTAGPAEIVAAALAQDRAAPTVGERTFGSASEQSVIALEDGGALVLTTALYLDPAGKKINETGVKPSVEMANVVDDLGDITDATSGEVPGRITTAPPRAHDDPVLRKALDLLRTQSQTPAAKAA